MICFTAYNAFGACEKRNHEKKEKISVDTVEAGG